MALESRHRLPRVHNYTEIKWPPAYADPVRMANIAQMVNVLQAMILTNKEKMVLTPPTYTVTFPPRQKGLAS
jgi:hypothetical protein